jgi:hypothetical protein
MLAPRIHKIICFLLLCLVTGVSLRHVLMQSYIAAKKTELRQLAFATDQSKLITIALDAANIYKDTGIFEWKENNRELIISGKYHEVVGIASSGTFILVTLIEDTAENELLAVFLRLGAGGEMYKFLQVLLSMVFISVFSLYLPVMPVSRIVYPLSSKRCLPGQATKLIKPPGY